jgi:hypothetical protein
MAQRKKTPKHLVEFIQRHEDYVDYANERIRVKTTVPVENQGDHIKRITVAEIEGQATGYWVAVEAALMAYGCYAGYSYVGRKVSDGHGKAHWTYVKPGDPDFAEWRRVYYVR